MLLHPGPADDDGGPSSVRPRGFPAFPARKGGQTRGRGAWARAWSRALEGAALDQESLARGRSVARAGRIGPVTVSAGRIAAQVNDGGDGPYGTVLTLRLLTGAEWERLWDETAGRQSALEAMLSASSGGPPPELLEVADECGVPLLPDHRDLESECGCGAPGLSCGHAAGLGYQTAWLLDREPELMLLLRGREPDRARSELKNAVLRTALATATTAAEDSEDSEDAGDGRGAAARAAAGGRDRERRQGAPAPGAGKQQEQPAGTARRRRTRSQQPVPSPSPALPPLPPLPSLPEVPSLAPEDEDDPHARLAAHAAERARLLLSRALGLD
ncbi:hypothetical protein [Streptomyces sp. YIM 98790]|uniref:SWIM zinc finger family protein n=1 Tax=Streptomyces sp. YIM 98790 TaxID=2689077 RepID=UPI0014075E9D|nr:hypothetical protein [Streptomyces sp. YIM 98790]